MSIRHLSFQQLHRVQQVEVILLWADVGDAYNPPSRFAWKHAFKLGSAFKLNQIGDIPHFVWRNFEHLTRPLFQRPVDGDHASHFSSSQAYRAILGDR